MSGAGAYCTWDGSLQLGSAITSMDCSSDVKEQYTSCFPYQTFCDASYIRDLPLHSLSIINEDNNCVTI